MSIEYLYKKPTLSDILGPYITNVIVKDLLGVNQKVIEVFIDTGYDGFLVLPINLYEELNMESFEVAEDEIPQVETFSGEKLTLRTANAVIEIPDLFEETIIEIDAHPHCKEPLIGRQLLEILVVTLNGIEKKLIIAKESQ
ncbi:MAG: hypothetical protein ACFFDI_08990 [Promethearchaeota archaeon]